MKLLLFVAQGFGAGRAPVAPGTLGSAVGVGWFALLAWPQSLPVFVIGTVAGLGLSVWICDLAERALQQKDPGSVVLDEIAVLPVCFGGWIAVHLAKQHEMPPVEAFYADGRWMLTLGTFALFRFFDVLKPWPIGRCQSLPGGWGVTMDDLLAALATGALTGLAAWQFLG